MHDSTSPKTVAVVSYITFIGWLVSYLFLYPKQKAPPGRIPLAAVVGAVPMWSGIEHS